MLSYVGLAHRVDSASYLCLLKALMLPNWLSHGSFPSLQFIGVAKGSVPNPKPVCLCKKQWKRQLPFNVMEAGGR